MLQWVMLSQLLLPTNKFLLEIEKYLEWNKLIGSYEDTCTFTSLGFQAHDEILTIFIQNTICTALVVDENFTKKVQSSATFIFITSLSEVNESLGLVKNVRDQYYFILRNVPQDAGFLPELMGQIWDRKILNFVVIFALETLQVFTYNPFNGQMMNVTGRRRLFFPDKVQNLHGYQLKVAIWPDWPLTTFDGTKWGGKDYKTLEIIIDSLNASCTLIAMNRSQNFQGVLESVHSGTSDWSANTFFRMLSTKNVEFTYPHDRSNFALLVPIVGSPMKQSWFLLIFDIRSWALLGLALVLTSLVGALPRFSFNQFTKFVALSLETLLGNPVPYLNSMIFAHRLSLVCLIWCSMVIRTGFQCFLITSYINPSLYTYINTIPEFRESAIRIYASEPMAKLVNREHGLADQFNIVDLIERETRILEKDTSGAYMINSFKATKLVDDLSKTREGSPFYVMEQIVLPGIGSYIFQKGSPYLEKVNKILQLQQQFGLLKETVVVKYYQHDEMHVVLGLKHLKFVFRVLLIGLGFGFIVFVVELICFSYTADV